MQPLLLFSIKPFRIRWYFGVLGLATLLNAGPAHCQVALKVNLLHPLAVKGASAALERADGARSSWSLSGSFGSHGDLLLAQAYSFRTLALERRRYLLLATKPCQGVFIAPYAKYMQRHIVRAGYAPGMAAAFLVPGRSASEFTGHSVGLGTTMGIQYPFYRNFLFDVFAGGGYLFYVRQHEAVRPEAPKRIGHLDLRLGVSVGYRF